MTEIEELETQLAHARENAKPLFRVRELAQKLAENPAFKELILDEFCTKEAARLVHMSADPLMSQEQRADSLAMAQAGGHLRRYLSMQIRMANVAEHEISQVEKALQELLQGEEA